MTELLTHYRDDGPLSETFRRAGPLRVPSLAITAVGTVAVAAGLAVDGGRGTGAASLVGIAAFVLLGMLGGAGRQHPRVQWLVPPMLRAGEYVIVATLAWRTGHAEIWLAYALLAMVAFHHYDVVYRLRHQHAAPSALVSRLCGGWEVRVLVVTVAAVLGVLAPALIVLTVWCGALYVSESMRSWVVLALDETRRAHVGTEIEEEEV
jgi:Family of unknown function (DUF5941)